MIGDWLLFSFVLLCCSAVIKPQNVFHIIQIIVYPCVCVYIENGKQTRGSFKSWKKFLCNKIEEKCAARQIEEGAVRFLLFSFSLGNSHEQIQERFKKTNQREMPPSSVLFYFFLCALLPLGSARLF